MNPATTLCISLIRKLRRRKPALLYQLVSLTILAAAFPTNIATANPQEHKIDFQRDIRPILSANCFFCHGPDEQAREADLRLDHPDDATRRRNGVAAIVPGDLEDSELIFRVTTDDDSLMMPPAESNKSLSAEDKRLLREWIRQGAEYEQHWAFVPPQHHSPPNSLSAEEREWIRNPIDAFTLEAMRQHGLRPNPSADRLLLARRVSLDLTGMPLTPEEADRFLNDRSPDAFERLVDRLLSSPAYGERWARPWLDLARYSDTNGYEKDLPRSIWPYRDWLIQALNEDISFRQFTIEQLAGDMLPDATELQRIATGFHRNTMTNQEGGVDPQEYRFYSTVDRVNTTATTWLGLTMGCAQCHTHKFDPISQTEYYAFFDLFNQADEPRVEVRVPEVEAERTSLQQQIAAARQQLPARFPLLEEIQAEGEEAFEHAFQTWRAEASKQHNHWTSVAPFETHSNLPILQVLDDRSVLAGGDVTKFDEFRLRFRLSPQTIRAIRLEVIPDPRLPYGGPGRSSIQAGVEKGGDFFLSHLELRLVTDEADGEPSSAEVRSIELQNASHSYAGNNRAAAHAIDGKSDTGWGVAGRTAQAHWAVFELQDPLSIAAESESVLEVTLRHQSFYPSGLGRFRLSFTSDDEVHAARDIPAWVGGRLVELDALAIETLQSSESQEIEEATEELRHYFRDTCEQLADARQPIDQMVARIPKRPTTLIMQQRHADQRRTTNRYHRGEYLKPRETVLPGIPLVLAESASLDREDRLGVAQWLVDRDNPLTARVTVNRHWTLFFGRGLVKTVEDFGLQGDLPTHPELLDWLAIEFMDQGWSIKHLHRLVVTSSTYRQSTSVTEDHLRIDPENKWLARSPRVRLEAETLRDSMLKASGLLSTTIGGPSVFPPQPAGITEATYSPMAWNISSGEDRYRRGLYTFNKRTAPFAMFTLFDAPTGESCVANRQPSNTPLQALTMLNDQSVMEASRALAIEVSQLDSTNDMQRVDTIFRRCLVRQATQAERQLLVEFHEQQRKHFLTHTAAATDAIGEHLVPHSRISLDSEAEKAAFAAWVLVARAVINLDEMICKP